MIVARATTLDDVKLFFIFSTHEKRFSFCLPLINLIASGLLIDGERKLGQYLAASGVRAKLMQFSTFVFGVLVRIDKSSFLGLRANRRKVFLFVFCLSRNCSRNVISANFLPDLIPIIVVCFFCWFFIFSRRLHHSLMLSFDFYLTTRRLCDWLRRLTICCCDFGFFISSGTLKLVTASTISAKSNPSRASTDKSMTLRFDLCRSR